MIKNLSKTLGVLCAMLLALVGNASAAIDALTLTEIKNGIASADTTYYEVGGAILLVLAGIWAFKMVRRMF
jgi:hypothetical protein